MFPCKNIKYAVWGLILLIILLQQGFAQDSLHGRKEIDSIYITDISDKLALRIYGINKFNKFSIRDNDLEHEIQYAPNNNLNIGIGVNYKWFGLGVAINFPFINNDDPKYGSTKRFDGQTNIYSRKFVIDFYLQYYKGFFIENPTTFRDNWADSLPYPQRPDIITTSLGASYVYVFNHRKYSAKAAFVQTDLQRKSAGSFLLGGYFSLMGITGDSSFIPAEIQGQYNPELLFKELSVASIGIAFGYSHTFVLWKSYYLSFTFIPGIASQGYSLAFENQTDNKSGSVWAGKFLARTAFVYNSNKSFVGLTLSNDSFSSDTNRSRAGSLNYYVGSIRFFYGRRFDFSWNKKKGL
ncbi:MAG: DUF4421 domain-containing protein [Bacteroidales bacterium]|nr:DUF4421 domain-containing protein [Bacteroidales bacterium]